MGNCCKSFTQDVGCEEKTMESSSMHSEGNRRDGRSRYSDKQATTSLTVHARNIENEREQAQCVFRGYHPDYGGLSKGSEAELVAAGWPSWSWMIKDVGEAFKGLVPRKEEAFRNFEKIGEGTYSRVYRALDLEQMKIVALKKIICRLAKALHHQALDLERMKIVALKKIKFDDQEPESTIRFMAREINILCRLNHPNIIKLEGLDASNRSCNVYLVLEYMEYMEHDLERLASHPGLKFTRPQGVHPAYDCVPKQNDRRHKQSIPGYANEDVRNRYRDPALFGYGYGLSSSRIRHWRPLPAPAGRPDPMLISRPLPTPEGRADQMIKDQDRYGSEAVGRSLAKGKQTRSQDSPLETSSCSSR